MHPAFRRKRRTRRGRKSPITEVKGRVMAGEGTDQLLKRRKSSRRGGGEDQPDQEAEEEQKKKKVLQGDPEQ